jgi:chitodextrinase
MSSARLYAINAALLIAVVSLYGCGGGSETAESGARSGAATDCPPFGFSCSGAQQQGGDTQNDTNAPSTPTALSGSASSPSQINLGWTASTDNVAVTGYRVYRNGVLLATLGNVNAYQNTGVSASTTYSYTVQAFDAAGNASAQSTAVIVTTPAVADTVAPSTPSGLLATAVSASRINLSWSPSTDNVAVTAYRVFRGGALLITLGNVTSFQDSNLGAGTTYVYTVRALDAAGNVSGNSAAASATTSAVLDNTPPTTPTNLTANATSPSQVALSWTASTDNVAVTDYRVYLNGALVANVTSTTYQQSNLSPSTTYTYNVDARDESGNVSGLSAAATVTTPAAPDASPPSTPLGLTAAAVSSTQINLTWLASIDNVAVSGYHVFRGGVQVATLGNVLAYQDSGLSAATTYSYRVRAVDGSGNVSGLSSQRSATTAAAPDTSPPTTPTGLTASAFSSSRINLDWNASTDNVAVTGYRVYRNGTFLVALGSSNTAFQDSGLAAATAYTYVVDAVDGAGNASTISGSAGASTLGANTATLQWDEVLFPTLSGYRVYFGTAPGTYQQAPGAGINVAGNLTSFTLTGLSAGTRYFFAVKAYDAGNNESGFSNEVFKDIP